MPVLEPARREPTGLPGVPLLIGRKGCSLPGLPYKFLQSGLVFRNGFADDPSRRRQLADQRGCLPDFQLAVCQVAFEDAPFRASASQQLL